MGKKRQEILHLEVKQAILAANIEEGDRALRALARVDSDAEFRAAIEAANAVDDKEHTNVRKVIEMQIPLSPLKGYYGRAQAEEYAKDLARVMREGGKAKVADVAKLLNERALTIAMGLLSDAKLKSVVEELIHARLNGIIAAALGLRFDSFGHGVEVDWNKNCALRDKIIAMAGKAVEKPLKEIVDGIDLAALAEKRKNAVIPAVRKTYEETYREALDRYAHEWAARQANLDVEKLFAEQFGLALPHEEEGDY